MRMRKVMEDIWRINVIALENNDDKGKRIKVKGKPPENKFDDEI